MADFGPSATQLPSPQGAGSSPIAPVTQEITPPNWGQALGTLTSELSSVAGTYVKQQKLTQDNAFLQQYAQGQKVLADGLQQGQLQPTEVDARARNQYAQALASRPDLVSKLNELTTGFQTNTSLGDATDARQAAQKQFNADVAAASTAGYAIPKNATQQQLSDIIAAHKTVVQTQADVERQYKANAEARAQGTFDAAKADRDMERTIVQNVNQMAGANMQAAWSQVQAIKQDSTLTPQQKANQVSGIFATYQQGINAIGGTKPQLVAGTLATFDNMRKASLDYIDPTKDAASTEAQVKSLLANTQLQALTVSPQFKNVVAASQLLGNGVVASDLLKAQNVSAVMDALSGKLNTPTLNGVTNGYTTPIVGNPDVEGNALPFLKKSITQINSGGYSDGVKATAEVSNINNSILAETGRAAPTAKATDLKGLADYYASPEYGSWVIKGKNDPVSQQGALSTFQKVYFPAVTDAIGNRLQQPLIPASEDGLQSQVTLAQGIDVKNDNGVLTFVPRQGLNLTPAQLATEQSTIKNLNEVQQSLNNMVRIGTHLEGSTDYSSNWEKNKYYYLPQIYPYKPGQVVGNLQYTGNGDWRDKSSWRTVGQR